MIACYKVLEWFWFRGGLIFNELLKTDLAIIHAAMNIMHGMNVYMIGDVIPDEDIDFAVIEERIRTGNNFPFLERVVNSLWKKKPAPNISARAVMKPKSAYACPRNDRVMLPPEKSFPISSFMTVPKFG